MRISDDLRARYLVRRHNDLRSCQEAIVKREFQIIERIGHQIRGNAESFGFAGLENIARQMECAARSQDFRRTIYAVKDLGEYLKIT